MVWERAILVTLAIVTVAVIAFILYDLFRKKPGKIGDSCSDNPCEAGLHCASDKICRVPLGTKGCRADADCEEGVCVDGECQHSMAEIPKPPNRKGRAGDSCRERGCGDGLICSTVTKTCIPSCKSDSECGTGQACLNGECVTTRQNTVTPCLPGSSGCGGAGIYLYNDGWLPYSSAPEFSATRILTLPTNDGYSIIAIGETKIVILVGGKWVPFFEASRGQTIIDATTSRDYFTLVVADGKQQSLLVFRNSGRELAIASRIQLQESWKSIDTSGKYSTAITTDNKILVGKPGFTEMKVILSSRRGADKGRVVGDSLYFIAAPLPPNRPAQLMRVNLGSFTASSVPISGRIYDMDGGDEILAVISEEGLTTILGDTSKRYEGNFSPESKIVVAGNQIFILATVKR